MFLTGPLLTLYGGRSAASKSGHPIVLSNLTIARCLTFKWAPEHGPCIIIFHFETVQKSTEQFNSINIFTHRLSRALHHFQYKNENQETIQEQTKKPIACNQIENVLRISQNFQPNS